MLQSKDLFLCHISLSDSSLPHYSPHCAGAAWHPLVFLSPPLGLTLVGFPSFPLLLLAGEPPSSISPLFLPAFLCSTPPASVVHPVFWHAEPLKVILVFETMGRGDGAAPVYAAASLNNRGRMDRWTIRAGTWNRKRQRWRR